MDKKRHMFAVCAYKKSEYLERCVKTLCEQTVKSDIIICTSTPNEYIDGIAEKYGIPVFIRDGASDIRDDWNFAYNTANASFVTVAHQDDEYSEDYVKSLFDKINSYEKKYDSSSDIIMFLTDYLPIKSGMRGPRDINCRIRKLLRAPLKSMRLAKIRFVRKMTLSLGNSIVCPSVTYNKDKLGDDVFTSELKFNIDWDTFLKLALEKGVFLYADKPLTFYRVHDGATSKEFIENHGREIEDTEMFRKFWPKWLAKLIMVFYKKAYDTYG
ncbi:MAG: glycosyltransferase [Lachnospiraceae bacterium]|nr:glycosyltransferase [Lachnospiraceae bacterium]